jgi:hypothetical protein
VACSLADQTLLSPTPDHHDRMAGLRGAITCRTALLSKMAYAG